MPRQKIIPDPSKIQRKKIKHKIALKYWIRAALNKANLTYTQVFSTLVRPYCRVSPIGAKIRPNHPSFLAGPSREEDPHDFLCVQAVRGPEPREKENQGRHEQIRRPVCQESPPQEGDETAQKPATRIGGGGQSQQALPGILGLEVPCQRKHTAQKIPS